MKTILQEGESVLRGVAQEVSIDDIKTPRIQKAINDMKEALESQDDGVAIAAPQIGVPLRIFVVSKRVWLPEFNEEHDEAYLHAPEDHRVFINPKIIKQSKKQESMEEGCLSVRWKYGKVMRSKQTTIEAFDENGDRFVMGASGLLSQIFQHETDHLEGVLFTDKAVDVVNLPPQDKK